MFEKLFCCSLSEEDEAKDGVMGSYKLKEENVATVPELRD